MGKASKIEWTDHTFNPWWGCTKVSAACKYCYAESLSNRFGQQIWGKRSPRRFFGDKHWREPILWNKNALEKGKRSRVFCASMADVFELRPDLDSQRERLWALIEETPGLDWLLLTKRPANIGRMAPWTDCWPKNVWLGITVESDKWYPRIERLLRYPAHVKFLSCEPLLSNLDLSDYLSEIDWVIAGGESGVSARPTDPRWVRSLRDQCKVAKVAFHFKQWGHWAPTDTGEMKPLGKKRAGRTLDNKVWDDLPTSPSLALL